MSRPYFYRNTHGRDLLDAFLVSAITSLLLVRFYLEVTGYPQLGGGSLHIAHMLYGGVFMMVAIVINLAFLGNRSRQIAAVIGGAGFGIFIDELGKFITRDNNYFFQPTIGIIYAVFVVLYLSFNFLTKAQRLTSREYQMNALNELEEAVAHDLDKAERAKINRLLRASDPHDNLTIQLHELVNDLDITAKHQPSKINTFFRKIDKVYARFWRQRASQGLINALFIAEIVILAGASIATIAANINDIRAFFGGGPPTYGQELIIGQVAASVVAAGFIIYGLSELRHSRLSAFEQFRRSALINIYLTQFFIFVRLQFDALFGLVGSIVILLLVSFVIRQERRLNDTD